ANDGVDVAGESNGLDTYFESVLPNESWRETILSAFQQWASETNANVGLVEETGNFAFGAPGARTGDARFGDIRIGARPLATNVHAVSVSHDAFTSGTWSGDVLFNTNVPIESVDQLFSVALHEAGHVFGLGHSDQPNSVMHMHGGAGETALNQQDIANMRSLYGNRSADSFDAAKTNDSLSMASILRLNRRGSGVLGATPTVAFADLGANDVDYYKVELPGNYTGPVTIRLRSSGVSLLAPDMRLMDANGNELTRLTSAGSSGDLLVTTLTADQLHNGLSVRVASQNSDFAIGAYSIAAVFDDINTVDVTTLEQITNGQFIELNEDEIETYFEDDEDLFNDDDHSNDDFGSAQEVEFEDSDEFRRFQLIASLKDVTDKDYFEIETPDTMSGKEHLIASVRGLDSSSGAPAINVFDEDGNRIESEVLINDGYEYVVQVQNVPAESEFVVEVESQSGSATAIGNYELSVVIRKQPVLMTNLASGVLASSPGNFIREFDVPVSQLMHFVLDVDGSSSNLVDVDIRSSTGSIQKLSAAAGSPTSSQSLLVLPGRYTIHGSRDGSPDDGGALSFELLTSVVSDPIGLTLIQPNNLDFSCPDVPDAFCYPGGIQSDSAFLWDEFLAAINEDRSTPVESLTYEWWIWYWEQFSGNNPPLSTDDIYSLESDATLTIDGDSGLLSNDVDPNNDRLSVQIVETPSNGTLNLLADGSFRYSPRSGFVGVDQFRYRATDGQLASLPSVVSLHVTAKPAPADFDGNGTVDAFDVDLLTSGISAAVDSRFDLNQDGTLNSQDRVYMIEVTLATTYGDSNLDGVFDSGDLVYIFQQRKFEDPTAVAGWADGDWNGDGRFNTADLVAAFQTASYQK
ncbi:MAG: cadherin-like domain-containing protein, partial [Planctomycetales bacterium]|nr:cadherin-like domain-containing protein [Planctomycetales bacterium]